MMRWVDRWNAMKAGLLGRCWHSLLLIHLRHRRCTLAKSYLGREMGDHPDVPEAANPYSALQHLGQKTEVTCKLMTKGCIKQSQTDRGI